MKIKTVAYYTDNYEEEVIKLASSCQKFGIDADYVSVGGGYTWMQAVKMKPAFIMTMLNSLGNYDGILYVDADAVFRAAPDWELFSTCHFAAHKFKRSRHHNVEMLTGTLYFANVPIIRDFVKRWDILTAACETSTPEQDTLKIAFDYFHEDLSYWDFGPEYVFIHDDFKEIYPGVKPVIEHFQASRRLRR